MAKTDLSPKTQITALADKLGVERDPSWTPEQTAVAIHDATQPKTVIAAAQVEPVPPPIVNTPDDVRRAIAAITAKHKGFEAIFEGDTWTFRHRGAEDSGNLAIPLRVIAMKAGSVAKGARRPMRSDKDPSVMMI